MANNKKNNRQHAPKETGKKPEAAAQEIQEETQEPAEEGLNATRKFKETTEEKTVIMETIKDFQNFCNTQAHIQGSFSEFAKYAGFETTPVFKFDTKTKIRKTTDLITLWTKFLEKNKDTYQTTDTEKKQIETILQPQYFPVERIVTTNIIKRLKEEFPEKLQKTFELHFPTDIDAHSVLSSIEGLETHWKTFILKNKNFIDSNLAKKLDNVFAYTTDKNIRAESIEQGIPTTNKSFEDTIANIKKTFRNITQYELFDKKEQELKFVNKQLDNIVQTYKGFPPYLNQLFSLYPYNHQQICSGDTTFENKYTTQQQKILVQEAKLTNTNISDEERDIILAQIKKEQKILESIKREGYANYISKSEPSLGAILKQLVETNFDMSSLSKTDQQTILQVLTKHKLENEINSEALTLLGINETSYKTFINDLFDLNKQDITIPTRHGPVPIHFKDKSFLGGPLAQFMNISNSGQLLAEIDNLPLNFEININESNKHFFEDNELFNGLFTAFRSKNHGEIKLNDAYKIRIKHPSGKIAEGYLSPYPPTPEIAALANTNSPKGSMPVRYLYSKPITRPEDDREPVCWTDEENGTPVVIRTEDEHHFDIDILSKDINLNGNAIGSLLLGYTMSQYYLNNNISLEQEKTFEEKIKKINQNHIYKDTVDHNPQEIKQEEKVAEQKEEIDEYQEFLNTRQNFKGFQTPETRDPTSNKITNSCGFEKGAKLAISYFASVFPPIGPQEFINMEIRNIDLKNKTFSLVSYGTETKLGKHEGKEITLPLNKKSLESLKENFGKDIYKLPPNSNKFSLSESINLVKETGIENPDTCFKNIKIDKDKLLLNIGDQAEEEVTHFATFQSLPGEDAGQEVETAFVYEIKHDPSNKSMTLTCNDKSKTSVTLDYPNFIRFVASRKLQPQTKETAEKLDPKNTNAPTALKEEKKKAYSINNILGFFKGIKKKIDEGLKKFDDEQAEECTEKMLGDGSFFQDLGAYIPSEKWKAALGGIKKEQIMERDSKNYKKIEKFYNFYTKDPDFGSPFMRGTHIAPFLSGSKPFKNHHQGAAMLLATIDKGKGPYSRNTDRAGKGNRVKIILGEHHQKRYLLMKEKLERELQQGYSIHGGQWASDLQNEIVRLEMKYITHCIGGRQLADKDADNLKAIYSDAFAGKLEESSNKFFKETCNYGKEKDYNFELARVEYFRLLGDRPQQAVPALKALACKAVTPIQWQVFESAVLTGMLSGVFYSMTQEDKGFIQKICRTVGFLPGMWIKDPNHHYKVAKLLDITTGGDFSKANKYDPKKFSYGNMESMDQIKEFVNYGKGFNKRFSGQASTIKNFVGLQGKNKEGKTLIELQNNPETDIATKILLKELVDKSLEKRESLDNDVKGNSYSLEQNIWAKSESVIDEVTDFQEGKFRGKDKDEIQGMADTWSSITKAVPKEVVKEPAQVSYILQKFFNWFEGRGFNNEEKKFLIRALLTIKEELKHGRNESAEEILRYCIVGTIVNRSGNGQPPAELIEGLEAFKDFFKTNLETIIQPDIIEKGFGSNFVEELSKGPYKVAPWEEYVDLRETKGFPFGLSQDQRKKRQEKQRRFQNEEIYINKAIYDDAENLKRKNYIANKFKKYHNPNTKKDTKKELQETLSPGSIKLKNTHIINKIKDVLSNREDPSEQDLLDEFSNMEDEEDYYNNAA